MNAVIIKNVYVLNIRFESTLGGLTLIFPISGDIIVNKNIITVKAIESIVDIK